MLTALPPSELQDKIFRVQGQALSMAEIAKILNTNIENVPAPHPLVDFLRRQYGIGAASTGWNPITQKAGEGSEAAGSANHLWAGHRWKMLQESLNL